jgi:hypothetical protein
MMLVSPVARALLVDALKHDGPGRIDRIDWDIACDQLLASGLTLEDLLGTEATTILYGVLTTTKYRQIGYVKPPLKENARQPQT